MTARRCALVFGEVLCDLFAPVSGMPLAEAPAYLPRLGGAPANVAVQLARLGVDVALCSAVGADPLGTRVVEELKREGVDVAAVRRRPEHRTGLTFVEVDADGERRFYGWRAHSADLSLGPDDVANVSLQGVGVVHCGTVTLRAPGPRAATARLVRRAHQAGLIASLDVNLRFGMFPDRAQLMRLATQAIRRSDVVKATRDEAIAVLGARANTSNDTLVQRLHALGPSLVMLTLDKHGALLSSSRARVHVPAPAVEVVDATGAGDAFVGAALARLLCHDVTRALLDGLDEALLRDIGTQACAAGSVTTTAHGATTAMPRAFVPA